MVPFRDRFKVGTVSKRLNRLTNFLDLAKFRSVSDDELNVGNKEGLAFEKKVDNLSLVGWLYWGLTPL